MPYSSIKAVYEPYMCHSRAYEHHLSLIYAMFEQEELLGKLASARVLVVSGETVKARYVCVKDKARIRPWPSDTCKYRTVKV